MKLELNATLEQLVNDIAEVAGYFWEKGWAEGNAGNISANITSIINNPVTQYEALSEETALLAPLPELANNYFFVTGTGKRMREIARKPFDNACLIQVNSTGTGYKILYKNPIKPTSELPTHLAVHCELVKKGGMQKIVLHTHPTNLIAITQCTTLKDEKTLNQLLWGMHPETIIVVPKGMGVVPYEVPGTTAIAALTIKSLQTHDVVFWEKHGIFAVGEEVIPTFDKIDTMAKAAEIYFYCKCYGIIPEGLSDKSLNDLKMAFNIV